MRILIVKTSSLGDIVQCFDTIYYLKQTIPACTIDWVVEQPFADLVSSHPDINHVLTIHSKFWKKNIFAKQTWQEIRKACRKLREVHYDLVLDLQGNTKSALVTAIAFSSCKVGFALPYVAERTNTWVTHYRYLPPEGKNIREDYLFLAQQAIQGPAFDFALSASVSLRLTDSCSSYGIDKSVLVFLGSAWKNKQLSEETLCDFLQLCEGHYGFRWLLAWGSAEEKKYAESLHSKLKHSVILEKLPLAHLQHLIHSVQLVIAMDSLPLHLTATTRTPSYSFFGPSSALKYAPKGDQHHFFQGGCPYQVHFAKRCPKLRTCRTGACLKEVSAMQLFLSFDQWWKQRRSLN